MSVHAALLFVSVLLFLLDAAARAVATGAAAVLLPALLRRQVGGRRWPCARTGCGTRSAGRWTSGRQRGSGAARYHVLRHVLRCVSVASHGRGDVVAVQRRRAAGRRRARSAASCWRCCASSTCPIVLPLLCNLLLSFFVPCIHLSFYLPYLPFPALQSPPGHGDADEDKGGMSEDDLTRLPTHATTRRPVPRDTTCAVCLCEVEDGEEIRQLTCRHMYHRACIDSWLRKRGVCPLCVRKVSVRAAASGGGGGGGKRVEGVEMAVTSGDVSSAEVTLEVVSEMPVDVASVDLHPEQLDA